MFTSGTKPVRPATADPNLPTGGDAAHEWTGVRPASAHVQAVNQDYFVSWNNKQAAGYSAADGNFSFGAVHRGDLLDAVKTGVAAGTKYDRASLLKVVERAGLSSWADNQWIRVDLGASVPVARVQIFWESAYASAYKIEVSADGATWTQTAAVAGGNGGVDNVPLTPATARYLRLTGITRATQYSLSLYELEIYSH